MGYNTKKNNNILMNIVLWKDCFQEYGMVFI